MCVIVDTNVASRVLVDNADPELSGLRQALFFRAGIQAKLVYGGRLRREYQRAHDVMRAVLLLDRAGRATLFEDREVDVEEERVAASGVCGSDDPHVIALARVSGARVLCSDDRALRDDFKKRELLDRPRGKVYSNGNHDHLLRERCR